MKKNASFVHTMTLKKSVFFFKVILWTNKAICQKRTFFSKSFHGQMKQIFHKSETRFSIQFSLRHFFCFLFEAQICLETCVNCVWNVRNGLNWPHESLNFGNIFFLTYFTDNLGHFSKILRPDSQNSFFLTFFFVFYSKLRDV